MNVDNNVNNEMQSPEIVEIQLRRIINSVLNNLWKIALSMFLCAAIAFAISKFFIVPMYRTSSTFYVMNTVDGGNPNNISSSEISTSKNVVNLYIAAITSRSALETLNEEAQLNSSYAELSSMISATVVNKTQLLKVTVTSDDPSEAFKVSGAMEWFIPERVTEIVKGSSAELWDNSILPTAPYTPNHIKNTALGLVVGLVLSIAIVVLVEISDITIMNDEDIKYCCNYPVLAVVPNMAVRSRNGYYYYKRSRRYGYYSKRYGYYSKENKENKDADISDDTTSIKSYVGKRISFAAGEAYKLLRTKLQYSFADDKHCHVIAVSSALAGEGKSISSVNTAYSFSQLNKRVLLIDCDMRRPTLARKLALNKYPGLSEYLTGLVDLDELLQTYSENADDQSPIYVITAGNTPPNPVELMNSQKMMDLITSLREQFDYIILDMPPINDVSDALVSPKLADGVLLVVHQNYSSRTAIRNAVQQFEFVDARILGVVFNCVTDRIGGYRQKRYGNRYSNYYTSQNSYRHETVEEASED